ncbi:multicopper oxidase domain-containing protein [Actinacidiphila sp. bgisy160]|uniref:multicopper oxidase domain-containing protein n=1 Tax=Actinacidiphila sp. bgisy160 TaxID=3413796 RepID=UPI003D741DC5
MQVGIEGVGARADDQQEETAAQLCEVQFPGPLLRFTKGHPVTIDVHNDTGTPEQLHWHGQRVPATIDGSPEEGTAFIPAHGMRRLSFVAGPADFRFYHTHLAAGSDLTRGGRWGRLH